ncbi:MAG: ribosome recycling factor [Alphaproteobacteria bacterium]|nr:ribosome recycling factor [Alphaproteobacteria bacterium]
MGPLPTWSAAGANSRSSRKRGETVASVDLSDVKRRMDSAFDVLKKEFGGLRTGRASPSLLDHVMVDAYGSSMPLNQCGTVGVPEARLITVQVWDRGLVKSIDKGIREAGLGLNPQIDGQLIRIPLPALTEDRRKELSKIAHKYAEQARVAVRNVRRDGMELLKKSEKDHKITEDEHRKQSAEVQKLTDEHIKKVDETLAAKEKEIMQV